MFDIYSRSTMPLSPDEFSTEDIITYMQRLFTLGDINEDGVLQPQEFAKVADRGGTGKSLLTVLVVCPEFRFAVLCSCSSAVASIFHLTSFFRW